MQSPKKIAVAGATGRVGHHAAEVLTARGHQVVPISRSQGVDVITGEGLAAALTGVECIIDAPGCALSWSRPAPSARSWPTWPPHPDPSPQDRHSPRWQARARKA
jgi:nucleoside-diphosphate-sugar epimerase